VSTLGNFVWSIADQLRGVYQPHQYGNVILPMTILRRLDCILEPTRDQVRALAAQYPQPGALAVQVKRATGLGFHNTSEYDFRSLLADPDGLRANFVDYLTKFSAEIDVFERFKFENEIATLAEKNRLYLVVSKFAEVDLHPGVISNTGAVADNQGAHNKRADYFFTAGVEVDRLMFDISRMFYAWATAEPPAVPASR
jgi:type I restriction enzyme M protein